MIFGRPEHAYNVADLRELARRRLPKGVFEYLDRGAEDEVALALNRAALERIKLKPRAFMETPTHAQDIELFGQKYRMPIVIAPTGVAGIVWYEGELALARAAAKAGIAYTLAMGSTTALETIAQRSGNHQLWFQLYMSFADRARSLEVVERARIAGYRVLVVTVDRAGLANREYNLRNAYPMPEKPFRLTVGNTIDVLTHPRWFLGVLARYVLTSGLPRHLNMPRGAQATIMGLGLGGPARKKGSPVSLDDLRALRAAWPHALVVKGVMTPEDAVLAVECGADGVVVSNHGGRSLDCFQAPIDVLPQVVGAVGSRVPVLVDSGFRRGSDVVKALALGARAVLIGRATLYGVAAAGEAGADRALQLLRDEIDRTLGLIGCPDVGRLGPQQLHRGSASGAAS